MQANSAFILAAGKGTRMGKIGEVLPKILWPILDRPLIYWQKIFCQSLGLSKQFINLHTQVNLVQKNIQDLGYQQLVEDQLLDVGGGIHNLKKTYGDQELFVQNADQFLFVDKTQLSRLKEHVARNDIVLLVKKVSRKEGYNKILVSQGLFKEVVKHKDVEEEEYFTYMGCSFINTNIIDYVPGISSFFDSVANSQKYKISIFDTSNSEYWDFGTLGRYFYSWQDLLEDTDCNSQLAQFLRNEKTGSHLSLKFLQEMYKSEKRILLPTVLKSELEINFNEQFLRLGEITQHLHS